MGNSKARRMFVVDDELLIAQTLALILRREGFVTEFFSTPANARLSAQVLPPDLLLPLTPVGY
jgi:DNA-binding response OmpR family regulator